MQFVFFPTSGKFCKGILSLRRDSSPQRPPPAGRALSKYFLTTQTNTTQPITKCSEANQVLGKPAGHQDTDATSQGKRHLTQAGSFSRPLVLPRQHMCVVELCQPAAACCSPAPCSPALLAARINHSCPAKPTRLCLHLTDPSPAAALLPRAGLSYLLPLTKETPLTQTAFNIIYRTSVIKCVCPFAPCHGALGTPPRPQLSLCRHLQRGRAPAAEQQSLPPAERNVQRCKQPCTQKRPLFRKLINL